MRVIASTKGWVPGAFLALFADTACGIDCGVLHELFVQKTPSHLGIGLLYGRSCLSGFDGIAGGATGRGENSSSHAVRVCGRACLDHGRASRQEDLSSDKRYYSRHPRPGLESFDRL